MGRYLAVRLYSMGITLAGLTVLVFLILRLVPGTVVEQNLQIASQSGTLS